MTIDHVKQLSALHWQLTPSLLLIKCPCEMVAKAWQLFNWYGGGTSDPTYDPSNRDSREAYHSWYRVEDRCVYVSGTHVIRFGRGAAEHNKFFNWLLAPDHEVQATTFDFAKEMTIEVNGSTLVPLVQNDKIKRVEGCEFALAQHVDNFHPRLSGYTRNSFVFQKTSVDSWLQSISTSQASTPPEVQSGLRCRRKLSNQEVVDLVERYKREGYVDHTKRAAFEAGISTARVRQLRADPRFAVGRNSWIR